MEQHPVPQNVTTFQFRLIGDMTLKQFGYLCAGAILAFISYKLPLPFIFTWPLTIIFVFLGVGFAFIPVEERPMDVWVFSFFKSIYNPTQYLWTREPTLVLPPKPPPSTKPAQPVGSTKDVLTGIFQPVPQPQPRIITQTAPSPSFMDEMFSLFRPKKTTQISTPPPPPTTGAHPTPIMPATSSAQPVVSENTTAIHQKMTLLETNLAKLEEQLVTKNMTEDRVLELQKQLTEVLTQKNKTDEELTALKREVLAKTPAAPTPNAPPHEIERHGSVNVITTQEGAIKAGLPRLTTHPNVVTGIVKDDTNNMLFGVLVTVTNADGIPVRALKTNKLGQFAASTQLPNGTYFVEIEDPRARFTFSRVQITLNGTVVPVLEVIAKSQKALTREKLAQEIFGKPTM